jgi:UDP-glucose 4-epimerase
MLLSWTTSIQVIEVSLISGYQWAVPSTVPLIMGNCGDQDTVRKTIQKYNVKSVIHFAAHISVAESVQDPLKYYRNNFVNSMKLIEVCSSCGIKNFIFSSTCAVYGNPSVIPVTEKNETNPLNAYSRSKMMTEWLLEDLCKSGNTSLRYVILRYFNVAGARVKGGLGQATKNSMPLIKVACEAAAGKRPFIQVYGTDYDTEDGTCIRDFIHVDDLASAHYLALDYLRKENSSTVFNCGYGQGYSVRQILQTVKEVSGEELNVQYAQRRPGDIVKIYSDPIKIKQMLKWIPKNDDIKIICETAYNWEKVSLKE